MAEELVKELVRVLEREGGEATPERCLYVSQKLHSLSRDELLEIARKAGIEVREVYLSPYDPSSKYYLLRLRGFVVRQIRKA